MPSRKITFYIGFVAFFLILIGLLIQAGGRMEEVSIVLGNNGGYEDVPFLSELANGLHHPMAILLLQIIIILIVARAFGVLASKIGQPMVVGEIIAGIVLGPSLLGLFFPEFSSFIFPQSSIGNLKFLSQIGLVFFMFIIGMELDIKVLRTKAQNALIISHAGIVFPFFLGMLLAYFLYKQFAPQNIPFMEFGLFMGIAMSITAFPVLARIIQERGLMRTNLGALAITSAAIDDITAWSLLAIVIAMVKAGNLYSALMTIGMAVLIISFLLFVVQPFLRKLGEVHISKETLNKKVVTLVFLVLMVSAYLTEVIGMNGLIGAFLAGVVMPQNLNFKKILADKLEDVSLVLFLPLFFVYTGLRTEIGLLNDYRLWGICLLIIGVATAGKFGAITLTSKLVGQSWRDSLVLGTLMNTRGLMELIVLNIGYDLGILTSGIFTMLVIMALTTTFMTGPLLNLLEKVFGKDKPIGETKNVFRILISFAVPRMGSTLLRLADQLSLRTNRSVEITALHITPSSELKPADALLYEKEGFQPIRSTAQLLGLKINTLYRNADDVIREIGIIAQESQYDLILLGAAKPLFNERATGGKLRPLLEMENQNMGILLDKGFVAAESVLVLVGNVEDRFLIPYSRRLLRGSHARVTVLSPDMEIEFMDPASPHYLLGPEFREVIQQRVPDRHLLIHFNLIIASLDYWNKITALRKPWIKDCPSVLVLKHSFDLVEDPIGQLNKEVPELPLVETGF